MHKYEIGQKIWTINFEEAEQLTVSAYLANGKYELASLPVKGMAGHVLSGWEEDNVFPNKLSCLLRILSDVIIFRDRLSGVIRKALPLTEDEAGLEQALEGIQELITAR